MRNVRGEPREPGGVVRHRAGHVAALNETPVAHQRPVGMREHRLLDAVGLGPPPRHAIFRAQGRRQLRRFAQREDDIGLVGQLVAVLQGALPELAPVMHHAGVVAELRLERALDHGEEQLAMLADERIIAGPIPVAA